jgi:heptosyltransferase II
LRLPNWIGDTVMALPSLAALRERGFELILVGKAWAPSLLQAFPEKVEIYPKKFTQRVGFLRKLARAQQCHSILLFTNSFSSALEAKSAGLAAIGFKHESRTLLLSDRLEQDLSVHQVRRFWLLTQKAISVFGDKEPLAPWPPARIEYPIAESVSALAQQRINNLGSPYILLCPFATGTIKGMSKLWASYAELAQRCRQDSALQELHWVVCPGPNEVLPPSLEAIFNGAADSVEAVDSKKILKPASSQTLGRLYVLKDVGLPEYVALMEAAHCVIANDSGPSHLAALVAQHQITIFGPGDPAETGPWSPSATVLGGKGRWPSVDQVLSAIPKIPASVARP